jgi:hypothetical protein
MAAALLSSLGSLLAHIVFQTSAFQPRLDKDAPYGGFAQTQLARRLSTRPMGAPIAGFLLYEVVRSRGLRRRLLLRASSPLKPETNQGLTLRLVQRTRALHRNH